VLELLRDQMREVITTVVAPSLHADLVRLLGRPGYALSPDGPCRAGVLALEIHKAVTGHQAGRSALLVASAAEFMMEAAYVFDEVADAAPYGTRSEDLALAIALFTAGSAGGMEAAADALDPTDAFRHLCSAYSGACAGQFLDAKLQRRGGATLEEALQATCLKSGGLGRFIAGFSARVSGADREGIALIEQFGADTLTYAQLADDLRDACAPGEASDVAQRKATLPVVFYASAIDSRFPDDGMLTPEIRRAYESSGASLYVAILAQAYLRRAREDLNRLAVSGYAVTGLVRFLQNIDAVARETLVTARDGLVAAPGMAACVSDPARDGLGVAVGEPRDAVAR